MKNKKEINGVNGHNGANGHNGHNGHSNGHSNGQQRPCNGNNGHNGIATATMASSRNGTAAKDKGKSYRPTEKEPFMNERQKEYFRQKLAIWRDDILKEAKDTLQHLQDENQNHPDLADRASSETDRAIELRARDRQRKLINKIDAALHRLDDGTYGYCEETGEPIGSSAWRPVRSQRCRSKPRSATSAASGFTGTTDRRFRLMSFDTRWPGTTPGHCRFGRARPVYFQSIFVARSAPCAHRLELLPDHRVVHLGAVERLRREAAVGAGHDVLAADELGEAHDPLGDQLGMLDDVAGVGDDAGAEHLALRHLHALEQMILVLVARIGGLEAVAAGVDLQHVFDDVGQRGLVEPRSFVDAVAGVEAHHVGRNALQRALVAST